MAARGAGAPESIVFVQSNLNLGGAEVLRARVLPELARRGMRVRLCLLDGCPPEGNQPQIDAGAFTDVGIPVDRLERSNGLTAVGTTLALARYLRRQRPDIVQSGQFNSNYHARIAATLAGVRIRIAEEHGLNHWKRPTHRAVDRWLSRITTCIIAVSDAVRQFNIETAHIAPDRIRVLHNPAPSESITPESPEWHQARHQWRGYWGISTDDAVLGTIGTLRSEKGHDTLVRAVKWLAADGRAVHTVIVGDGPLRKQTERLIDELGLRDRVHLAGTIRQASRCLPAFDTFIFPSRNEALGLALLEAMSAGLPCIGSRAGGIPEVIRDGETGLLTETNDDQALAQSIRQILDNPELAHRLGAQARLEMRRDWRLSRYVDQLLDLYRCAYCS